MFSVLLGHNPIPCGRRSMFVFYCFAHHPNYILGKLPLLLGRMKEVGKSISCHQLSDYKYTDVSA